MKIREFVKTHFRHFNAAVVQRAAEAYVAHLKAGNKMFLSLAGAMSTAELGISLAEMIRQDKVHAICCTGANLEEDLFNLVAHEYYKMVPNYRDITPEQEKELLLKKLNRVTDTCIPEEEAMLVVESAVREEWQKADKNGKRFFPHEYLYSIIRSGALKDKYQIDPKNSWLVAACEKNLTLWVPGWEDSTLGNMFVGEVRKGTVKSLHVVKNGLEYMSELADFYLKETKGKTFGYFQIGGGIAGDFAICVVPLIKQDLKKEVPVWSYYCQVSDSTTSYGSYSGAVPNEKITWCKLAVETPKFMVESDASIVAPLIFSYVLDQ